MLMQDPPTIKPSTSSNSVDPFNFFPEEIFILLFYFSNSTQNLKAARTNQNWRRVISSNPQLFSVLYFSEWEYDAGIEPGLSELEYQLKSNKVIERIIQLSNLSKHRLEEASLIIKSFFEDHSLSAYNWRATKLSTVFNVLRMSASSLKRLNLDINSRQADEYLNLIHSLTHVVNIVNALKSFEALQEVNIETEVNFSLSSGALKKLNITESGDRELFSEEWELLEGYGQALSSLLEKVCDFTGEDIRKFHHNSHSGRSSDALRRLDLQQSKESLEELELCLRCARDDGEETFSMVTAYSNLKTLAFFQTQDDDDVVYLEDRERRFEVPKGARSVSKLESVEITLNEGQISLNDGFWKWVGGNGTLHTLVIDQPFYDGAPNRKASRSKTSTSIDFQSFQSLLLISGSSLIELSLSGLYLPPGMVKEQLRFTTLSSIYLQGNSQLINVVMKAEFPCLQILTLVCEGSQSSWIDHYGIVKALGTCRDTIEDITIRVIQSSQEAGFSLTTESNFERMKVSDRSNALFLPKVRYLNLQVDDATISRFYLPIDYLGFSLFELPSSSRFSESSFFQRGKSQSPAGSGK